MNPGTMMVETVKHNTIPKCEWMKWTTNVYKIFIHRHGDWWVCGCGNKQVRYFTSTRASPSIRLLLGMTNCAASIRDWARQARARLWLQLLYCTWTPTITTIHPSTHPSIFPSIHPPSFMMSFKLRARTEAKGVRKQNNATTRIIIINTNNNIEKKEKKDFVVYLSCIQVPGPTPKYLSLPLYTYPHVRFKNGF